MGRRKAATSAWLCLALSGCVTQADLDQNPTGYLYAGLIVLGVVAVIVLIYAIIKSLD